MPQITYQLLGAVRARNQDGEIALEQPRVRLLLAILLLNGGEPVPGSELIARLWDEDTMPDDPAGGMHTVVSLLRRVLRGADPDVPDPIPKDARGYRLDVEPHQIDALRFRELWKQARSLLGHDDAEAARLCDRALAEWGPHTQGLRGPRPLDGVRDTRWLDHHRERLRSEHREVLLSGLEAELNTGGHQRLLRRLDDLARADEASAEDQELARLRMIAHARAGRTAAALDVYRRISERTRQMELDIDPRLQRLHDEIAKGQVGPEPFAEDAEPESEESPESAPKRVPIFGDTHQYGDNAKSFQAQSMTFNQRPEER